MTKKIKDLAVKVGSYEHDGKTKNRYLNIGAVLETDDGGKFILLDRTFNPAGVPNPDGKATCLISMFDVKDKTGNHSDQPETHKGFDKQGDVVSSSQSTPKTADDIDEIPF